MQNPQPSDEILSLTSDIREQLSYLHELGVETVPPPAVAQYSGELIAAPPADDSPETTTAVVSPPLYARRLPPQPGVTQQARPIPVNIQPPTPDTLFGVLTSVTQKLEKSSETFAEIWADIGDCTRCPLHERRTNIVHTEGNRRARLMFIGEAPGADEDAQGRPFVGRAGQLLTKIIEAIGFKREDVLIGNVNRCRPPGNRPPTEEEATMCKPFLLREIASVQPEVIVVMGNTATRNLLNARLGITKLRGEFQDYHGVKVMPTFHPAYLLRDPSKKQETWKDLKKVRDYLEATASRNP